MSNEKRGKFVRIPREPTQAMIDAYECFNTRGIPARCREFSRKAYAAMIEVAEAQREKDNG